MGVFSSGKSGGILAQAALNNKPPIFADLQ
jgi:hypothetical protein